MLRRSGATRVSALLYLTPPTTMVWALAMFGQSPDPLAVPGVVVCAVGVYLVLAIRAGGPTLGPMTAASTGPTIVPTIRYADARAAIEFLSKAFGFTAGPITEGAEGAIVHVELTYADAVVMLGSKSGADSPYDTVRVCTYLVTDTPDALHDRALDAGAEIVQQLSDQDYGSRELAARDPEGNVWAFGTYRPSLTA